MSDPHLVVVALGGNALLTHGQRGDYQEQFGNARRTGVNLTPLLRRPHHLVITHGNGPQVGNLLIKNEKARHVLPTMPLDVLVANTQGGIGYLLQQSIQAQVKRAGLERTVLTLVTQTVVDAADPAFQNPTKPIGPFYDEARARKLMAGGWTMVEDAGRGWRRVVPSPKPREIIEFRQIKQLSEEGHIVVAVGGGGIPVVRDDDGTWHGVEAVVDKDRATALLAHRLEASYMVILTEVPAVCLDFGKPGQKELSRVTVSEARRYIAEGHFAPGSMLPKVESAVEFIEGGGKEAIITCDTALADMLADKAGTRVVPDDVA